MLAVQGDGPVVAAAVNADDLSRALQYVAQVKPLKQAIPSLAHVEFYDSPNWQSDTNDLHGRVDGEAVVLRGQVPEDDVSGQVQQFLVTDGADFWWRTECKHSDAWNETQLMNQVEGEELLTRIRLTGAGVSDAGAA